MRDERANHPRAALFCRLALGGWHRGLASGIDDPYHKGVNNTSARLDQ